MTLATLSYSAMMVIILGPGILVFLGLVNSMIKNSKKGA